MKKLLKTFLVSAAAAALLAVCASTVLLCSSGLQTRIANGVLAGKFPNSSVESLSVGLGGLGVSGLKLPLPDGTKISLDSVKIKYSLSALLSNKVEIESAKISGARVALAKKAEGAAQTPQPAEDAKIAKTDAATPQTASGGAAGETKKSSALDTLKKWEFSLGQLDADAQVIAADGSTIKAVLSAKKLEIQKNLKPVSGNVSLDVAVHAEKLGDENFSVQAEIKNSGKSPKILLAATRKNSRLLALDCDFSEDFSGANGNVRADVSDADLAALKPFVGDIPSFKSSLFAAVKYSDFGKNLQVNGVVKNQLFEPSQISKQLGFLGECELSGEFSASVENNILGISKLDAYFSERGKSIVFAKLASPVKTVLAADAGIPEGKIEITANIPARYATNFVGGLDCSDIGGKLAAEFAGGKIVLKTVAPVSVSRIFLKKNGEYYLKNIAATLSLDARAALDSKFDAAAVLTVGDSQNGQCALEIKAQGDKTRVIANAKIKGSIDPFAAKIYSVANLEEYRISVDSDISAVYENATAKLEKFGFAAFDKSGKQMAKIATTAPLSFDTATKKLSPESGKIATITAQKFPFAPIKPFAAGADAKSVSLNADVSLKNADTAKIDADAELESLYFKQNAQTLVADITVKTTLEAEAKFDATQVGVKITKCSIASGGTECAMATANFDGALKPELKIADANANLTAALPALLAQPAAVKFANVSAGNLTARAGMKNNILSANARIDNLKTYSAQGTLDNIEVSAQVPVGKDFKISEIAANLSGNSTRGHTEASLKIGQTAETLKLDADAKSVVVEDLLLLSKAFSNPNAQAVKAADESTADRKKIVRPQPPKSASASAAKKTDFFAPKDAKAFWYVGKKIDVTAMVGTISYGARTVFSDAKAVFTADESALSLNLEKADLLGSSLTAKLEAAFDAGAATPYKISALSAKIKNFESAKIFADAENPMVSGVFDAEISAYGAGNNAAHLFQYLTGEAVLKSSGGHLRLIDKNTSAGATANLAGTALKITGAILKRENNAVSGIGEIVSLFTDLKYDSVDFRLSRDSKTYDFDIVSAEIKTPDMLLSASGGEIYFNPDAKFADFRLDIPVNVALYDTPARAAFVAAGFGKKKSEKFADAYDALSFKIYGTVSKPENNLMKTLLGGNAQAKSDDSREAIRKLGGSILNSLLK